VAAELLLDNANDATAKTIVAKRIFGNMSVLRYR